MNHDFYMRRCFEIALCGTGNVAPNPLVGAVLVYDDKIISDGYHQFFGGPHAEVNALKGKIEQDILSKSTLYVNLEPCSHFGKTPPCANLIVSKGISKVVVSNLDPNPAVNGNGIMLLKSSGIEVITGVLENEGFELNRRFFTFHIQKRPYVILKWAQSADGFIAPSKNANESPGITWISGPASRLLVHKWRSEEQSILIGKNTALNDNPKLNVRGFKAKDPIRIIIDPELELPMNLNVFDGLIPTIIFNHKLNKISHNLEFVQLKNDKNFIENILHELQKRDIQSVLVEGGAITLNSFIEAGLWDEMRVFTGSTNLIGGIKAPEIKSKPLENHTIEKDQLTIYRNL